MRRARVARPGLWHWQARHPDWRSSEPWDKNVSSCAIDDNERLLLFDPLGVPSDIEALAAERETAIVLTAPWHERDAERLVERLGVPVYTPLPDSAQYLDQLGAILDPPALHLDRPAPVGRRLEFISSCVRLLFGQSSASTRRRS